MLQGGNHPDERGDEFAVPAGMGEPAAWPTGTLLAMAGRMAERAWNRRLTELGVTASGVALLLALAEGPASQAELATTNRMSAQATGRGIERLERGGLVERRRHPGDRRRAVVTRTPAGAQVLQAALRGQPGEAPIFDQLDDHHRLRTDLLQLITLLSSE
jgi:DNA-binding MarR family transcriptional regulator